MHVNMYREKPHTVGSSSTAAPFGTLTFGRGLTVVRTHSIAREHIL